MRRYLLVTAVTAVAVALTGSATVGGRGLRRARSCGWRATTARLAATTRLGRWRWTPADGGCS